MHCLLRLSWQFGYSPESADKFQTPLDADVTEVSLASGDVIIQASDGCGMQQHWTPLIPRRFRVVVCVFCPRVAPLCSLYDNLFDADIIRVVSEFFAKTSPSKPLTSEDLQRLSQTLLATAYDESYNRHRDSPFALLAKDNDVMWRFGGRPDDITVLTAYCQ